MLRVTPYKARGPSLIRGWNAAGTKKITIDREDGWGASFKTDMPHPYTVFQTISRKISWDPDTPDEPSPDRDHFSEAWHSHARSRILDKFVVARYFRVGAEGSMSVVARAWCVPDHVSFAAAGFVKGTIGGHPWADTHGKYGVMAIPPGTNVLERRFLAEWDNEGMEDTKNKTSHYYRGKDMEKVTSNRQYTA